MPRVLLDTYAWLPPNMRVRQVTLLHHRHGLPSINTATQYRKAGCWLMPSSNGYHPLPRFHAVIVILHTILRYYCLQQHITPLLHAAIARLAYTELPGQWHRPLCLLGAIHATQIPQAVAVYAVAAIMSLRPRACLLVTLMPPPSYAGCHLRRLACHYCHELYLRHLVCRLFHEPDCFSLPLVTSITAPAIACFIYYYGEYKRAYALFIYH